MDNPPAASPSKGDRGKIMEPAPYSADAVALAGAGIVNHGHHNQA